MMPHPRELTAHQAPALVVDALLSADGCTGARVRLRPGLTDLLQLSEGCAQAVAVLMGWHGRAHGAAPASGLLVAIRRAKLHAQPRPEPLLASIERIHEFPPFTLFAARVERSDGQLIAELEFTIMAQPSENSAP